MRKLILNVRDDELRAKIKVGVRLDTNDRSVDVTITSRMFEGDSCDDDDPKLFMT